MIRKKTLAVKTAHSADVFRNVNKTVGVQRHHQYFLHMRLLSHDNKLHNYIHRGTTSTVFFICKSRTNKAISTSGDTRSIRRPINKKVTKMNECKQ